MKKIVLSALLFINGCGGCTIGTLLGLPHEPKGEPTFVLGNNIRYFDHTKSGKFKTPYYKERLQAILNQGQAYWGNNDFHDYDIEVIEVYGGLKCGLKTVNGCTNTFDKVIQIDGSMSDCLEDLAFIHEQGHAFNGDVLHWNSKFRSLGIAHKNLIASDFEIEDSLCQEYENSVYNDYWDVWDASKGF